MHYALHVALHCLVLWENLHRVDAGVTSVNSKVLTTLTKNVVSVLSSSLLADTQFPPLNRSSPIQGPSSVISAPKAYSTSSGAIKKIDDPEFQREVELKRISRNPRAEDFRDPGARSRSPRNRPRGARKSNEPDSNSDSSRASSNNNDSPNAADNSVTSKKNDAPNAADNSVDRVDRYLHQDFGGYDFNRSPFPEPYGSPADLPSPFPFHRSNYGARPNVDQQSEQSPVQPDQEEKEGTESGVGLENYRASLRPNYGGYPLEYSGHPGFLNPRGYQGSRRFPYADQRANLDLDQNSGSIPDQGDASSLENNQQSDHRGQDFDPYIPHHSPYHHTFYRRPNFVYPRYGPSSALPGLPGDNGSNASKDLARSSFDPRFSFPYPHFQGASRLTDRGPDRGDDQGNATARGFDPRFQGRRPPFFYDPNRPSGRINGGPEDEEAVRNASLDGRPNFGRYGFDPPFPFAGPHHPFFHGPYGPPPGSNLNPEQTEGNVTVPENGYSGFRHPGGFPFPPPYGPPGYPPGGPDYKEFQGNASRPVNGDAAFGPRFPYQPYKPFFHGHLPFYPPRDAPRDEKLEGESSRNQEEGGSLSQRFYKDGGYDGRRYLLPSFDYPPYGEFNGVLNSNVDDKSAAYLRFQADPYIGAFPNDPYRFYNKFPPGRDYQGSTVSPSAQPDQGANANGNAEVIPEKSTVEQGTDSV